MARQRKDKPTAATNMNIYPPKKGRHRYCGGRRTAGNKESEMKAKGILRLLMTFKSEETH